MTDLRDTARDAARADSDFDNQGMSNLGHHRMRGADIAADLYELEVERWRKHARNLTGVIDAMLVTGAFTPVHKEILDEVKEALK